jgi:NAD(P)-dependent dehydrogenase (short-subunit alcohol dehydrogenase family)
VPDVLPPDQTDLDTVLVEAVGNAEDEGATAGGGGRRTSSSAPGACDLTEPASIRWFADEVASRAERVGILVNNGARYLETADFGSASDEDIVDTIASGASGTVLTVKHFLPLLSARSDPTS